MIFNYPHLQLRTKEVVFRNVLWYILFSVSIEMVEYHISEVVPLHLLAKGSRQTPNFVFSYILETKNVKKKIQMLISPWKCLFSDVGSVLKQERVPCIQLPCKKWQHFL